MSYSSFTSSHGWTFLEMSADIWKFQLKHENVSAELIFSGGGAYRSGKSLKSLDDKAVLELQDGGNIILRENGCLLFNIWLPVTSYNTLRGYVEGFPDMCSSNVLYVYDYVLIGGRAS